MKPPWIESKGWLPWMLLMAAVLGVAVLIKEGRISTENLKQNKDAIEAASSIVTAAVVIIGGVLSYLKFFKGRLFKPKLILKPQFGIVPLNPQNLHWLDIEIENKGSVPIWNYKLQCRAVLRGDHGKANTIIELVPTVPTDTPDREYLVDVGESAFEHRVFYVPKSVEAVTIEIVLIDEAGTQWERFITTSNRQERKDHDD
jgi:hypothetical protein